MLGMLFRLATLLASLAPTACLFVRGPVARTPPLQRAVLRRAAVTASQPNTDTQAVVAWLEAQPGWSDGEQVAVPPLYDSMSGAGMSDDAFDDAVEELEEAGVLRIMEGATDDDTDYLVNAVAAPTASPEETSPSEAASPAEASPELPPNAVPFDLERHEAYDYEAEAEAASGLVQVLARLKRFGVDKADRGAWADLEAACTKLAAAAAESPAPPLRDDPRLLGDWELVGTSSKELGERSGLTGLGGAPFTSPAAIFVSFDDSGEVVSKEVLEFWGQTAIVNELRGKFGFSADGKLMQERYSRADLGGQRDSPNFTGSTATLRCLCVTADGKLRLGSGGEGGAFFVYKKLEPGAMHEWLKSRRLPIFGGTVAFDTPEEQRRAYPYMK